MASRSAASALRASRALRTCPAAPARTFSASTANGARHTFIQTEDPELNKTLTEIQEKIIFPAFLPPKQRKLVFDANRRTVLAQNPVIIEVDGQEHRFAPLSLFTDIPNSKKIFKESIDRMKTPLDWSNLPILLSGYKMAKIRLKPQHYDKIVRLAGDSGNIYEIIECVKQTRETGMVLYDTRMVVRLLAYINDKIIASGWKPAETVQAMKWSQIVLDLVQRSDDRKIRNLQNNYIVRGLQLFARVATIKVRQRAGEEVGEQIALLTEEAQALCKLWTHDLQQEDLSQHKLRLLKPFEGATLDDNRLNASMYARVLAQNIKAVSLAQEVLGEEVDLREVDGALNTHLAGFLSEHSAEDTADLTQLTDKVFSMELRPWAERDPWMAEKKAAQKAAKEE